MRVHQMASAKHELDHVNNFSVRKKLSDLTDDELRAPLNWHVSTSREGRLYYSAIIDLPNKDLRAPLVVAIPVGSKCEFLTAGDRILDELDAYRLLSFHVNALAVRIKANGCIMPVNILATSTKAAYDLCNGSSYEAVAGWYNYVDDCRRLWKQEITDHLLSLTQNKCWYCGCRLFVKWDNSFPISEPTARQKRQKLHIDHQQPLSRGGSDELDNMVACCAHCNNRKGAKTLEGFREYEAKKALEPLEGLLESDRIQFSASYKFWYERQKLG